MNCETYSDGRVEYSVFPEAEAEHHFANAIRKPGLTEVRTFPRVNRNQPCPCGSGKKFKKCHLGLQIPQQTET